MRRTAVFLFSCAALGVALLAPSMAGAATFPQCPAVDLDTGCQFLVTVTDSETTIESDSAQGPYEGSDDALIGIRNNSSNPVSSISLSAEDELFGFENDGICSPGGGPIPTGCVVQAKNSANEPTEHPKETCPPETEACGFVPPSGEPSNNTFGSNILVNGFAANGDAVTGYEGPTSWFTGITGIGSFTTGKGVVNFSPALAPGASTYFSLESPPVGGFGTVTTLATSLSGGGQTGAAISVVQGTPVTDSATLSGPSAANATGTVSFAVYSDSECKTAVGPAGSAKLSGTVAGPSSPVSLPPGQYYWQAHYAGNLENQGVLSPCGSEVLTVLAPTTTTTVQSGGGVSGSSLTVPSGTSVTDRAHIAGSLAASATGTVSYVLYKNNKCTVPVAAGTSAAVVNGVAGPSAAIKPKVGTYYWKATYSGGGLNAPSVSACGSEILIVALKTNLGLPSSNACLSRRKFVVHPRAPHNVKLVSVEIQINGKTVKRGRLSKRQTTLSLIGLPKGTFKVALITKSSTGKLYEDIRTFHTCVSGHHKKK
jgi:hypothetical protein